jgi:polyisoprenoid-binding protein YceI
MAVSRSETGQNASVPAGAGNGAHSDGGVTVQLRTSDGWAVQHGVLTVTDFTGRQVARAIADADGNVVTAPLPPGSYTAIITAPGYAPLARTTMVGASGSASLGVLAMDRVGGHDLPSAGQWTIDPAHSSVQAISRHIGLSSVKGRFTDFEGTIIVADPIERSSVHAVIQADSIDTGSKMRDDHLRSADFLDVARFPTLEFRSTRISNAGNGNSHGIGIAGDDRNGSDAWYLDGELTLRGVTRPVRLDLTYLGTGPDPWGGTRAACRASTELHREEFAMNFNQVVQAGINAIGTTLRIELDIRAVRGKLA